MAQTRMTWTGEAKVWHVASEDSEHWVIAETAEQACDEVAGREALPFEGRLRAIALNPAETFYVVYENPEDVELIYEPQLGWQPELVLREGFTVTQARRRSKVTAPAWRWAQAYEELQDPYAFSFEPKILGSR